MENTLERMVNGILADTYKRKDEMFKCATEFAVLRTWCSIEELQNHINTFISRFADCGYIAAIAACVARYYSIPHKLVVGEE